MQEGRCQPSGSGRAGVAASRRAGGACAAVSGRDVSPAAAATPLHAPRSRHRISRPQEGDFRAASATVGRDRRGRAGPRPPHSLARQRARAARARSRAQSVADTPPLAQLSRRERSPRTIDDWFARRRPVTRRQLAQPPPTRPASRGGRDDAPEERRATRVPPLRVATERGVDTPPPPGEHPTDQLSRGRSDRVRLVAWQRAHIPPGGPPAVSYKGRPCSQLDRAPCLRCAVPTARLAPDCPNGRRAVGCVRVCMQCRGVPAST